MKLKNETEPHVQPSAAWPTAAKQYMKGSAYRAQPTFQQLAPDEIDYMMVDLACIAERLASHLLLSELNGTRAERIANLRMHVFTDMIHRSALVHPGGVRDAYACALDMMAHLTAAMMEVEE